MSRFYVKSSNFKDNVWIRGLTLSRNLGNASSLALHVTHCISNYKWFQGISGEHICIFLVFVVCFETGSQNVAQAGGILVAILLPWFIECWNYRHALSNLVSNFVLFGFGFDFLNHNSSCSSRSPRKAM